MISQGQIIGTWKLVKLEVRQDNGSVRRWGGDGAKGLLTYSPDGYMSVCMNGETIQSDEAQRILDSLISYAGPYEISEDTIFHQVEVASKPSRIGKKMIRHAELKENQLTLDSRESYGHVFIYWEKV